MFETFQINKDVEMMTSSQSMLKIFHNFFTRNEVKLNKKLVIIDTSSYEYEVILPFFDTAIKEVNYLVLATSISSDICKKIVAKGFTVEFLHPFNEKSVIETIKKIK